MIFTLLVFLAALSLELIGTWVSVIGLSSIFSGSPVVIVLAICLDFAKLVSVSFLYKYWKKVNFLMKSYMTTAAMVLMLITSVGAFGFLSKEFQQSIADTNTSAVMIKSITDEQVRLQARKTEIDAQIAKLPDNFVSGRTKLMKQFAPEVDTINARLTAIDAELPKLKIETLKKNVEVGPIIYVAQAFSTTPEEAVKWIILVIIFVFDPLAISLLIAGNFLLAHNKKKHKGEEQDKHPEEEASVPNMVEIPPAQHTWESTTTYSAPLVPEEPVVEPEPVVEEPVVEPEPVVEEPVVEEPVAEPVKQSFIQGNYNLPAITSVSMDIPEVEPEVVSEPVQDREVIKLASVLKAPAVKSSLETVSDSADVVFDYETSPRDITSLKKVYQD